MSDSVQALATRFRQECDEDAVGLWQIAKAVNRGASPERVALDVAAVVGAILIDSRIALGQFVSGEFRPWPGTRPAQLARLEREIIRLEGKVDIGDIGWLVRDA